MAENIILEKSYRFALRIVRLCKFLHEEHHEFILSKQLLMAGTFVGARVKSSQEVESYPSFIRDMSIALERASETEYWLQLIHDGGYIDDKSFDAIHADCVELIKLLISIIKTSKKKEPL
jgi:four helix bundle protein